ncbi:hypothetical protein D6777_02695 [Candidatus Woesearchaeota archaeon]|nr:MAG: hypothetical protein D6777_02695 [Candidatus Woesearchaeota archaeon]
MKKLVVLILFVLLMGNFSYASIFGVKTLDDLPEGFNVEELCVDTDAGKDNPEYKRGYVQDINGLYWDQCVDGELVERTCQDGFVKDVYVTCKKGCYQGACVKYFNLQHSSILPITKLFSSFFVYSPPKKTNSKYYLQSYNLEKINEILYDIDQRLSRIEKQMK